MSAATRWAMVSSGRPRCWSALSASVAGLLAFGSFGLAHLTLGLDLGLAMVLAMGLAGLDGLVFGRGMWRGIVSTSL